MIEISFSQVRLLLQTARLLSLTLGILGSISISNIHLAQAQTARVVIPVQDQTYSRLVEQARPLVWQQLAQHFGSDPDRYMVTIEVFGQRGESKAPILLVTMNRDTWEKQPAPAQLENHAQFFLSSMSLLYPPTQMPNPPLRRSI
jgi:hypothetical protein